MVVNKFLVFLTELPQFLVLLKFVFKSNGKRNQAVAAHCWHVAHWAFKSEMPQ